MRHTYQQTVTVVQLAKDCANEIYKALTADTSDNKVIVGSDSVTRMLHIHNHNGSDYLFPLNGQYLAITDNHCWVMTADKLDAQDVKEG